MVVKRTSFPEMEFNGSIVDVAIKHVKQKAKEDSLIQRYQVMKKRPQTEAQARGNMITYLKNTAGFRLDFFKGMSYDNIRPIFKAKFNANMEFLLKPKEQIEEEENRALETDFASRKEIPTFKVYIGSNDKRTLELMLPRNLKKNTKCFNVAGEELSAVKHKLMLLDTAAERTS
nr:hypothetical protein [Tanacetum cinerariifolium]